MSEKQILWALMKRSAKIYIKNKSIETKTRHMIDHGRVHKLHDERAGDNDADLQTIDISRLIYLRKNGLLGIFTLSNRSELLYFLSPALNLMGGIK